MQQLCDNPFAAQFARRSLLPGILPHLTRESKWVRRAFIHSYCATGRRHASFASAETGVRAMRLT